MKVSYTIKYNSPEHLAGIYEIARRSARFTKDGWYTRLTTVARAHGATMSEIEFED